MAMQCLFQPMLAYTGLRELAFSQLAFILSDIRPAMILHLE